MDAESLEKINDILERAREKGYQDGLIGWDKADGADLAELGTEAVRALGYGPDDVITIRRSLDISDAVGQAYNEGWRKAYRERGGGRALADLAASFGIPYNTLAKAAREGRIGAWKSGETWLTTWNAMEEAIQAGKIRKPGQIN
jgi:hypothetical protein